MTPTVVRIAHKYVVINKLENGNRLADKTTFLSFFVKWREKVLDTT